MTCMYILKLPRSVADQLSLVGTGGGGVDKIGRMGNRGKGPGRKEMKGCRKEKITPGEKRGFTWWWEPGEIGTHFGRRRHILPRKQCIRGSSRHEGKEGTPAVTGCRKFRSHPCFPLLSLVAQTGSSYSSRSILTSFTYRTTQKSHVSENNVSLTLVAPCET